VIDQMGVGVTAFHPGDHVLIFCILSEVWTDEQTDLAVLGREDFRLIVAFHRLRKC
jgi:hypothetical protein